MRKTRVVKLTGKEVTKLQSEVEKFGRIKGKTPLIRGGVTNISFSTARCFPGCFTL